MQYLNQELILKICVLPTASAEEVLIRLQSSGLGICIVTSEQGAIVGTITDGDCRRAFLRGESISTTADRIMNTRFIVVDESLTLPQIESIMDKNGIEQIPVVNQSNCLVNIALRKQRHQNALKCKSNPVVILAGGKGKRLLPLTENTPKPMLKVGDQPVLEHILSSIIAHGFEHIYFSVNYLAKVIENYFGDGSKWGCNITYIREEKELGTAGPLSLLDYDGNDSIIVINGDVITKANFNNLLDYHLTEQNTATICSFSHQVEIPFGVISLKQNGKIREIIEKPSYSVPVSAGIYVLEPSLLPLISPHTFFTMPQLIDEALNQGATIGCFHLHEIWQDIGTPLQYLQAKKMLS
jgi:dTDP-glucose pyrophosphorylase/predicted transcriptional regulator